MHGAITVSVESVKHLATERNSLRNLYGRELERSRKLEQACRIMLRAFDELGHTNTSCPITADAIETIRFLSSIDS